MPKVYEECGQDVLDIADELIRRYYQDIQESGLTIRYLFASDHLAIGGCLKKNGYPVPAIVKANSYKQRVEGMTDCTITIDKEWWEQHDRKQCAALIDHELYHILLARDDDGKYETDDCDRPKVTLRKHDVQIGGFRVIADRHKSRSVEFQAVDAAWKAWVQPNLDFPGNDMEPSPRSR